MTFQPRLYLSRLKRGPVALQWFNGLNWWKSSFNPIAVSLFGCVTVLVLYKEESRPTNDRTMRCARRPGLSRL